MEWTGQQQIDFLLQSFALGCGQGMLLDILTGLVYINKRRRWLWTDILFGPLAAVVTFFGSLVIMDGQLHPLLLFAVFAGILTEHQIVGVYICRLVRWIRRLSRQSIHAALNLALLFVHIFWKRISIMWIRTAIRRKNVSKP